MLTLKIGMKKIIIPLLFIAPVWIFSQSVIGNINSGAVSENNFSHSVGEIYVIPTDPEQNNSGTMGLLYQTVLQVLGVDSVEKDEIKIYPNPTSDFVFIKLNSKKELKEASIIDLSGKLVSTVKISDEKIDLRFLQPGVYFISFKNSEIKPIKIIKKP